MNVSLTALMILFASAAPTLRWELPITQGTPLSAREDVGGRPYLYLAQGTAGFSVLKLRGDRPPTLAARIGSDRFRRLAVMDVCADGQVAYLALGDHFSAFGSKYGLAAVDIKDPRSPRVTGLWVSSETRQGASRVQLAGNRVYLAAMSRGVVEFERSDISKPTRTFMLDESFPVKKPTRVQVPNARDAITAENWLVVANDAGGLRLVDLQTMAEVHKVINPTMLGRPQAYNSVLIRDGLAYVAVDYAGIEIWDLKLDPPKLVSWWNPWKVGKSPQEWFNSPGHTNQIAWGSNSTLFISAGDSELAALDVSNPSNPVPVAGYGRPKDGRGAWGISVTGETAYLTYIKAVIPFRGTWSGIRALRL